MRIRLLATDHDGTLLDDYKRLSAKNMLALQEAYASGIEIALCTGRPYHTVAPYLSQLKIPCWLITNNGAVIRNRNGDIIHTTYMQRDVLDRVLIILDQPPRLYFHGSDNRHTYIASRWQRIRNLYGFERKSLQSPFAAALRAVRSVWLSPVHRRVQFKSFTSQGGRLANLIIISGNPLHLEKKRQALAKLKGIHLTRSGVDNLEVLACNSTKGNALRWLAEYLGITMKEVAAIGDHDNDASMIRMAGYGFATENAEPHLKAAADLITTSNNEDALWHMVLSIKKGMGIGSGFDKVNANQK